MKRYQVKLNEGHSATPEQIVDGHLGYNEGSTREVIDYHLKWAKKKAEVFGGNVVGIDLTLYSEKALAVKVDCTDMMIEIRKAIYAKVGFAPVKGRLVVDATDMIDLYEEQMTNFKDNGFLGFSMRQLRDLKFICEGYNIAILEGL